MIVGLLQILVGCGPHTPPVSLALSGPCERALASDDVKIFLADLEATAQIGEVWPDYALIQHDLVIEWREEATSCVVHWSRGQVVESAENATPVALSTPHFGFLVTALGAASVGERWGGFLTGDVPEIILSSLRQQGAETALVLLFDQRDDLTSPGAHRFEWNYLAHHESAHVALWLPNVVQSPVRPPWPTWAGQPDKHQLVSRCYAAPAAEAILRDERDALVAALRAAYDGDPIRARTEARLFIEKRQRRYSLVDGERVQLGGDVVTCPDAEAMWEFHEGGADYITMRTLEQAGLWSREAILERIAMGTSVEPYYHTGAAQLLLLSLLVPTESLGAIDDMRRSERPSEGVYGQMLRHFP